MKKVPFDLSFKEDIIAGKVSVVTRNNKTVRIVCFDRLSRTNPILALVKDGKKEEVYCYNMNGCLYDTQDYLPSDLFVLVSEPESADSNLTDFEEAVQEFMYRVIHGAQGKVKEEAQKFLSVARMEIEKAPDQKEERTDQKDKSGVHKILKEIESLFDRDSWLEIHRIGIWRKIQQLKE